MGVRDGSWETMSMCPLGGEERVPCECPRVPESLCSGDSPWRGGELPGGVPGCWGEGVLAGRPQPWQAPRAPSPGPTPTTWESRRVGLDWPSHVGTLRWAAHPGKSPVSAHQWPSCLHLPPCLVGLALVIQVPARGDLQDVVRAHPLSPAAGCLHPTRDVGGRGAGRTSWEPPVCGPASSPEGPFPARA